MKTTAFLSLAVLLTSTAIAQNSNVTNTSNNPFFLQSTLPYSTEPFDKIKDADYKPAFEEGMKQHLKEIEAIANNTSPATFENTYVAMEKSGQLLTRVNNAFSLVSGANTNDSLQQLQEEIAPQLAAHQDAIYLNTKLFARVQSVYQNRLKLNLDEESRRLADVLYLQFVLNGAKLSDADKAALKKLNEEEASLTARFNNQLLAAAKKGAVVISDSTQLAGLSQSEKDAFAQKAKDNGMTGKWLLPLQNTTQQPVLQSLSNREVRERIFKTSVNRAEQNDSNDTRPTILRIAAIRAQKAKLMGYPSYAAWKLQDQMAATPAAVDDFFAKLVPSVTAKAREEAADIQKVIDEQKGGFALQPWDWNYYAEQVRKARYNMDENEVKPYFELNKVLQDGVFYAANQLYGLTFKERKDLPVYQPDVRVFEVFDADGKSMALFYCDYYKRDNKQGGAWMSNLVGQSYLMKTKPVIYNVCNFTKPAPGKPSLVSFDDVTTMFHEFGHGLHGLFASQKYPTLSGTNTARDFVEFPSQFNEHWALYPSVLKHYAVHYQTGETIPQSLIDKIKKASSFNEGYGLTEAIAAASLDMQWHQLTTDANVQNADSFETEALRLTKLNLPQVPPRYHSTYFLHIWSNGYAAGYYAYQWTKMLEEDAYSWFEEHGGLTRANGQRFRNLVLSRGNTMDLNTMFYNFRGHKPDIKPMEKAMGLPVE